MEDMNSHPDAGIVALLQRVFVCAPDVALSIGRRASDRRYPAKAVIAKQGDRSSATFLVVTGRAHALAYGFEGQLVLVHEFLPGDFFGAIADTEPAPEDADIVSIEDVRAGVFLALDFIALIETHSCVGLAVSRMLLRRLRATAARMVERNILSAAGRVHAELLRLARLTDGRTVRPPPVLAALAVRIHSTRETVSRTINDLERRGIIRREVDVLVIVAPHRLEEMIV
jgi:CRP/FNR family transcriptional regulator, cyclic AMP receptor protein